MQFCFKFRKETCVRQNVKYGQFQDLCMIKKNEKTVYVKYVWAVHLNMPFKVTNLNDTFFSFGEGN